MNDSRRAVKATGKNKNWYNMKDQTNENEKRSFDPEQNEWKAINLEESLNLLIRKNDNNQNYKQTKQGKSQNLSDFETSEEVQDSCQNVITKWCVMNSKEGSIKTHLIAHGFEECYSIIKDSSIVGLRTIRIILTFASSKKWTVKNNRHKICLSTRKTTELRYIYIYIKPLMESKTLERIIQKFKNGSYGLKDRER